MHDDLKEESEEHTILDRKTLDYIYRLERKNFELSLDALKDLLYDYGFGSNDILLMDESQLLKAFTDLHDSHAMLRRLHSFYLIL